MVELVAAEQFENVTVRGLSRLAGVSTGTFYKHFENVEDCFGATYESLMQRALREAYRAQQEAADEDEGVRAGLRALLTYLAKHPKEAQLVLVEVYAGGPSMRPRMLRAAKALAGILGAEPGMPVERRHAVLGVGAGVTRVARSRLRSAESESLPELDDVLGDWALAVSRAGDETGAREAEATARHDRDIVVERLRPSPDPGGGERDRILAAVRKLSVTGDVSTLTVADVCAQAGLSRRAFKAQFADVRDSFLESAESLVAGTALRAQLAARGGRDDATARAIQAVCDDISRNPALARLCFVDVITSGREGLLKRERWVSLAAERLRAASTMPSESAGIRAEASVASVWQIADATIAAGRATELSRMAPLLHQVLSAAHPSGHSPADSIVQA